MQHQVFSLHITLRCNIHQAAIMEYKSINNIFGRELRINLPKCGDERNTIENYHIEDMKHEENAYVKITLRHMRV